MLKDITGVECIDGYKLYLQFEDGTEGTLDVSKHVEFVGVLEPLADERYFAQVRVNPEIGTICWPNGADLDADVLYSLVTGQPIDIMEPAGVSVQ